MIQLPQQPKHIIDTLTKAGFQAYAVGGSVRDFIMDKPTKMWDFTTNAKPEEILALFPDSFYDNQFGTVGVKIYETSSAQTIPGIKKIDSGNQTDHKVIDIYEITTYRSEQGYGDFRHPDSITWGTSIEEDLSRRDFTINAIAFDGNTMIDPYNGQEDISKKIVRAVGDPDVRITEDALRMMRAIRIASQLGFMIEEHLLEAIKKNAELLTHISAERIRDELIKLLASPFAADGIMLLKNTGILVLILPELDAAFRVGQKSPKRHHIYDVGTHSVMALKHCPSTDPIVRLATLLHDIGKVKTVKQDSSGVITFHNHEVVSTKMAREICTRLRLSNKQTEKILTLIRWHQFTVDERQTDSAIRRFIRHVGKEHIQDMLDLRIGDRLGGGARETSWRLELYKKRLVEVQKQPFTVADLKVDGHDVMNIAQCRPGPVVGNILNQLFAEVEAGTISNKRNLLLKRLEELNNTQ